MSNLNHQVLRTAEFWGADPTTFEIIETHLSWVFLVNDLAYKLKKPVSLYFVDTTSLENRKHFCQEEVRLNSRWAQPYYIGVETINGEADAPVLNGDGEVLDYLVKMRRWSPEQQLDRQTLETDQAAQLALRLSQLQGQAAIAGVDLPYGNPTELSIPALLNFQQVQPVLTERHDLEQLEQLSGWADEALKRLWPRMAER